MSISCSSEPQHVSQPDVGEEHVGDISSAPTMDAGTRCEGFPSPEQVAQGHETLVVVQALEQSKVDGALDEAAYADAPAVEFSDASGASDNRVSVRALWDSEWLYLGLRVWDEDLEHDATSINVRDGFELMLDVDNAKGDGPADDHHVLISIDGDIHTERYTASGEEPETELGEQLSVAEVDGGYVVEFAAPLSSLSLQPSDGLRVGLLIVNNDRDDGEHRAFTWPDSQEWKNPSTYGEAYFAASNCESNPLTDAGVEPDADTDTAGCSDDADFESLPHAGPAVIGGGPQYSDKVCRDEADVVVSTRAELEDALGQAGAGDVVFIDPDAVIDMGFDANLRVPEGVTLSGGRGCDCRAGALLFTNEVVKDDYDHETVLRAAADSRITGLRIRGPLTPGEWIRPNEQDHYLDGKAIGVGGADVEIDNNEIWGFAHAGISAGLRTHVHHNYLHDMTRDGLGYGVNGGDNVLIEYNYFDWVRHAVANGGRRSYEARYNYMGENAISHVFDMHRDGGGTVSIHHNTVAAVDNGIRNKKVPGVTIRGVPSDIADIHHNWFFNPEPPRDQPVDRWTDEAIVQMHVTQWTNVSFSDNHYGSSDPGDCEIGAPRDGCP